MTVIYDYTVINMLFPSTNIWEKYNYTITHMLFCQLIYGANALRGRFQLLLSFSDVLSRDSIYKADLSDLCDFKCKQKLELDPYHICILRVSEGKTEDKIPV